eukprot:CAMPEP_0194770066 /NCGR_PEP_ID=MMETSP0323_2-20130528/45081_1 /TAXON_ID=2866 ORGANISM="Crypthecodinium cohnii, Strain Seligo" /NCGR_SAMPLE_ID=MMETSP0323_2 /ASSEMBLY_ACC=CAM_ASM_000346 /LENGTH=36 /DNA_ID= /DNA_START= /DNA_END= /DNA_ORIENTATION=
MMQKLPPERTAVPKFKLGAASDSKSLSLPASPACWR